MSSDKDLCFICKKDEQDDVEGAEWICCCQCEQWMHIKCINLNPVPAKDEVWHCKNCLEAHVGDTVKENNEDDSNNTRNPNDLGEKEKTNNDDENENELKMLNELIRQQSKLCELQRRRLEVMDRMNQNSTSRRTEGCLNMADDDGVQKLTDESASKKTCYESANDVIRKEMSALHVTRDLNGRGGAAFSSGVAFSGDVLNSSGVKQSMMNNFSKKASMLHDICESNGPSKLKDDLNPTHGYNVKLVSDQGKLAYSDSACYSNAPQQRSGVLNSIGTSESLRPFHAIGMSNSNPGIVEPSMATLLQAQMQLMCRTYLEDLPQFDGDIEFWPIFYAQFKSTTMQANFDDTHNLCRLRKALKGEALEAVKGLLALPNSLESVMEILQHRFGNMDVIVRRKIKGLNELQAPNESKPNTIKNFHEYLRSMYATLINAGADEYLQSPQTLDAAVNKLPHGIMRSWLVHKKQLNGRAVLKDFVAWFERYYDCAILFDRDQQNETLVKRSGGRVNFHSNIDGSKSTGVSSSIPATDNSEQCCFCRKFNHTLGDCNKFMKLTSRKRWEVVRKRRLCFLCLLAKHNYENCTRSKVCDVNGCQEKHHRILHKTITSMPNYSVETKVNKTNAETAATVNDRQSNRKILFRVVPVVLYNPDNLNQVVTWAFLDEGSSPTMMSEAIAAKLGVSGTTEELCMSWTDSSVKKEPNSQRVTIEISGVSMSKRYRLHNVRTVSELNLPMPDFHVEQLKTKFKHLADVTIPNIPRNKPELLIGLEHAKLGLAYEYREGTWDEPIATRSRLGWSIYGKDSANSSLDYLCHVCECNNDNQRLDDLIRDFFTTEAFGVKLVEKQLISKDEERARNLLESTTRRIGCKYETGLLWRSENVKLPNNNLMARRRLECFEQKLLKSPELNRFVLEKLEDHVKKGYLRKLSLQEVASLPQKRHWYLPIFTISNVNKPNKTRIVFDAAAKYQGISLNDMLLKGPDQLSSLFGVLLRFREGMVALSSDIAEMFHRVNIKFEDQYCQLVMWRNMNFAKPPDIYAMTVMTFGSTCSPSSAQYVKNLNATRFNEEMPRAVDAIVGRHYVDDWLDSFGSEAEAIRIARQVRHIHSQGGFEIRNFVSNSRNVERAMNTNVDDNSENVIDLNVNNELGEEKVLGLQWKTCTDEFLFRLSFQKVNPLIVKKIQAPTKREVLKLLMSIYDPFGFLSIITVSGKIFLQDVWRTGIEWDQKISNDMVTIWNDWLDSLHNVTNVKISRWLFKQNTLLNMAELHIVCDASESAFAACAYVRYRGQDDHQYQTALVAAKTKVAPRKTLSIPRLELQACVLATRLLATITTELSMKLDRVFLWTDSQTALGWIRSSNRKYSSFVSHRVSEILDSTFIHQWFWIPSKHNVADDATRGMNQPVISDRWFTGPDFFKKESIEWPKEKKPIISTDEEVRRVFVNVQVDQFSNIQSSRFSKYERLLRSMAYVIQYMSVLKERTHSKNSKGPVQRVINVPSLNSNYLEQAELMLLRKIQSESYGAELALLKVEKNVSRKSKIYALNPVLDNQGLIRLSTRVEAAPVITNSDMRQPILLDTEHPITMLMVDWMHRKFHHRMKETVVNELRLRFWIPRIRVLVNQVVRKCSLCKYLKAKAVIPKMSPLPYQRLQPYQPVFTFTGIDFFGPLEVTVGRRREKRWGCIFTCLTSRAIHLELASSLDTNSAIMCFRNFSNRRGTPVEVFSDNGTNLKAAEKELRLEVEKLYTNAIQDSVSITTLSPVKTKWTFIPPGAPHFGGAWERMVRTVKSILYIILQSKTPRDETLRSALIEIENIINSRPLTYSPNDVDSPQAITPNLLLRGPAQESVPFTGEFDCRKQWRISQALADAFWKRWLLEYIPLIAHRTKWHADTSTISIGQLVLIIDETLRRNEWKKGIVTKVFPSRDGRIRSAEVRTAKNTYIRPVAKLAIIKEEIVDAANPSTLL